jgi:hypothetical protein
MRIGRILDKALRIVQNDTFYYRVVESIETNDIGNSIAKYGEWIKSKGSVQPGLTFSFNARGVSNPAEIARSIGLDLSKNIRTVYSRAIKLSNISTRDMPDQIMYDGKVYNIWSVSDWYEHSGWQALICVEDTRERSVI